MKVLGIIPARFASTRFPGKPLVQIFGKTMIQHVFERAKIAIDDVVVATDDERILRAVESFGGKAVMTSDSHNSGTDRCFEALEKFEILSNKKFDIVVNIQGDEPLINPKSIEILIGLFNNTDVEIGTLANIQKFSEEIENPNRVKIVMEKCGKAIYFSRSVVPYIRDEKNKNKVDFYTHLGIYAYRTEVLKKIIQLDMSMLEIAESLEQNRWIENGYKIFVATTDYKSIGVDTQQDIDKILEIINVENNFEAE